MKKVNFTAFDFETATYDRMPCQLGLVVVREGKIVEEKEFLIKPPENKYDSGCIKIHGITAKDTEQCAEFDILWNEIKPYFEHELMVGHGVDFDKDVLDKICQHYGLKYVRTMCYYNTISLYNTTLENVANAYGFQFENHHNALADARMCAKIYLEYLKGYDISTLKYPERNKFGFERKTRKLKVEDLEWIKIDESATEFFKDKKAVMSGEYSRFPVREDLQSVLENYGVTFVAAISKNVDIFIVGDDYGPKKMEKVLELNESGSNIKILPEKQLYELLKSMKK